MRKLNAFQQADAIARQGGFWGWLIGLLSISLILALIFFARQLISLYHYGSAVELISTFEQLDQPLDRYLAEDKTTELLGSEGVRMQTLERALSAVGSGLEDRGLQQLEVIFRFDPEVNDRATDLIQTFRNQQDGWEKRKREEKAGQLDFAEIHRRYFSLRRDTEILFGLDVSLARDVDQTTLSSMTLYDQGALRLFPVLPGVSQPPDNEWVATQIANMLDPNSPRDRAVRLLTERLEALRDQALSLSLSLRKFKATYGENYLAREPVNAEMSPLEKLKQESRGLLLNSLPLVLRPEVSDFSIDLYNRIRRGLIRYGRPLPELKYIN